MFTNYALRTDIGLSTVESFTEFSYTGKPDIKPWDSSDPFFSARTRDIIKMIGNCYIRQLIVFVGIPGNAMSCVVFMKQGLSDRINLLLFWLAVADLITLLFQLIFSSACYFVDGIQIANWHTIERTKIVYVNLWSVFVSGTLIMVMSVDRCLFVAMPLKARRLLTYRPMAAAILLAYLVPLVFHVPGFLAFTVKWRMDATTNRSIAYMAPTDWLPMDTSFAVGIINTFSLVAKPAFLIIVVVSCFITIIHLRQASRKRLHMTGQMKEETDVGDNRITKMLLFLCVVYGVLILPDTCSLMMVAFVPNYFMYKKYHNTFIVVYQLIWIASCLNSATNVFAYLVLSSRFRRSLKGLWYCSGRKTPQQVKQIQGVGFTE